jgi:hypothetical protein
MDSSDASGCSTIEEVELQRDDGPQTEFTTIFRSFHQTQYTFLEPVRGQIYRFRYRVRNIRGWSDYSDITYAIVSTKPDPPPKPSFTSGTDTQVQLSLDTTPDNKGIPISSLRLELSVGSDFSATYSEVTTYDGSADTVTLLQSTHSLGLAGTISRVRLAAINEDNMMSDYSEVLIFALGSLPSQPDAPFKIIESSGPNIISIGWNKITGDTLPILGYKLYSDTGRDDDFTLIYDGTSSPNTLEYTGIQTQSIDTIFRVKLKATNINGDSLLFSPTQVSK